MRYTFYLLIIGLSFSLISWRSINTNPFQVKNKLKGPIKMVVKSRGPMTNSIVVENFNKSGLLEKRRLYARKKAINLLTGKSLPEIKLSLTDTIQKFLRSSYNYEYSSSKKLISSSYYDELEEKIENLTEYKYNSKDSLILIIRYTYPLNENPRVDSTSIVYHPSDSTLTQTAIRGSDTLWKKRYFIENQKVIKVEKKYSTPYCSYTETIGYNQDGLITYISKSGKKEDDFAECRCENQHFIYNQNQQVIKKESIIEGETEGQRYEVVLSYDSLGNLSQELIFTYSDEVIKSFSDTHFNQEGDPIEWFSTEYYPKKNGGANEVYHNEKSEYTYDKYGNWLKVKRVRDGEIKEQEERLIQYYVTN